MIGVSPAFFFSLYSTDFSVHDYGKGLEILGKEGFSRFQLEIYKTSRLNEWEKGYPQIKKQADELGMKATQFVAHFLSESTMNPENLLSDFGFEEMKRVVAIASNFSECKTLTVPLLPFAYPDRITIDFYKKLWDRLAYKIGTFAEIAAQADFNLALEIVPGSLLNNADGLLRIIDHTGIPNLGYNFDTGHAFNAREAVLALPAKLGPRIYGTHLKDSSWSMKKGNSADPIDWKALLGALFFSGYEGSLDLEIPVQDPQEVLELYRYAKQIIEQNIDTSRRDL
jgi:sugar phosphate isomerase/epimerase